MLRDLPALGRVSALLLAAGLATASLWLLGAAVLATPWRAVPGGPVRIGSEDPFGYPEEHPLQPVPLLRRAIFTCHQHIEHGLFSPVIRVMHGRVDLLHGK